ncbi:MAG: hypothetical protein M1168_03375 [Candidatus Marsarchaeota archaeon]|nr:hypothetical protein [Candidatus Marsarchaeota archaeon]MCL5094995.1 hypothetical protein [Candidatus Marsarchaeota archaeon]
MIGKSAKDKGPISITEALQILNKRKEENKELTYEQDSALKHATKFAIPAEKFKKLKQNLEDLKFLDEILIIKILDILPKNEMLLRQILAYSGKTLDDKQIESILNIIK